MVLGLFYYLTQFGEKRDNENFLNLSNIEKKNLIFLMRLCKFCQLEKAKRECVA